MNEIPRNDLPNFQKNKSFPDENKENLNVNNQNQDESQVQTIIIQIYQYSTQLHFLINTFISLALILFGNHFNLTLILIQTFRITAMPIILSNYDYLKMTFDTIRTEIENSTFIQEKLKSKLELYKEIHASKEQGASYDKIALSTKIDESLNDSEMVKLITKLMDNIDPVRVNNIFLALITGSLSCLVTLKDRYFSMIAQGMEMGKNLAEFVRVYTDPLVKRQINQILDVKVSENVVSTQTKTNEPTSSKSKKELFEVEEMERIVHNMSIWVNLGLDYLFMGMTVLACWQVVWLVSILAAAQLGATILAQEVNRLHKWLVGEGLDKDTINVYITVFVGYGVWTQVFVGLRVPTLIYILFAPVFWIEQALKIQVGTNV